MPTKYTQEEPTGAGIAPAGDPSTDELEIEYHRGMGDPTTLYQTEGGNAVVYTPESGNATIYTENNNE